MNFLPVAQRELRLLAGRRQTYRARAVAALVVMVLCLGMLYAGFGGLLSAPSAGQDLFLALSCLAAGYVLFDGVLVTADCLSQERRDGTLGLLFLTDLKGYDIVLGKLVSRVANAAYCLLGTLPALAIALFLGGVTGQDFFHMALALINGLFFAASFGMITSALCREERRALNSALSGVFALAVLLPAAGWGWSALFKTPSIPPLFLAPSPAGAFLLSLGASPAGSSGVSFGGCLLVTHLIAWSCLAAASFILPRAWGNSESGAGRAPRASKKNVSGSAPTVSFFRGHRWLEHNPFLWRGDRPGERGLAFWPFFTAWAAGSALGGWAVVRSGGSTPQIYPVMVLLLHLGLMYLVAVRACRGPAEDQRSGVLELVLTTPLGAEVYLRGRLLSQKRRCLWPFLLVLTADMGLTVAGCWQSGPINWAWLGWFAGCAILLAKLVIDLYALSWVGLWQGLKARNTGLAVRKTLLYLFGVRWIVLLGVIALAGLITQGRLFQSAAGGALALVGYLALLIMSLLHYCGLAMTELRDDLRTLALE